MRSNPDQRAFSAGEISPLLYGRTDYQRVQAGLRTCRGFLPLRQGGVTRAPGTIWRGETRESRRARLLAFEFAADDAVVLEFTHRRMRVWRYSELVLVDGAPYELATPYDDSDLDALQWEQSADVIYMVDGRQPPQRLARNGMTHWSIGAVPFEEGPFEIENDDKAVTITASAEAGTITLTGTGAPFTVAHVGSLMQLRTVDDDEIPGWVAEKNIAIGERIRYDGKIYESLDAGDTGTVPPTHEEGVVWPGRGCPKWRFVCDDIGIVRITAVATANSATAAVVRRVPPAIVAKGTYRWAEGAWSARLGWPSAITIHDQRLVLAGTPKSPRTVWFSAVGDYRYFRPGTDADDAFAYTIAGRSTLNRIVWLQSGARGLSIGALGEEYASRSGEAGVAIGPTNFAVDLVGTIGVAPAMPAAPDGTPLFIARDRRRLFELRYSLEADASRPVELSLPSEHLGAPRFAEIAWQSGARLGWVRRMDGSMVVVLADPAEDVLGWAVWPCAGGVVESVCVSRDRAGVREWVFLAVRRGERRFIERLGDIDRTDVEPQHLYALRYATAGETPLATVGGLDHLEGQAVHAWTDLGAMGPLTVLGGAVALAAPCAWAYVGLYDDSHMIETLDLAAPVREGASLGRQKRVKGFGLRWHRTARAEVQVVEREFGQADIVSAWSEAAAFHVASDNAAGLSGVASLSAPSGWAKEVTVRVRPVGGAPLTLLAATAIMEAAGG